MKKLYFSALLLLLLVGCVAAQSCPSDGFMGTAAVNSNITVTQTCPTCTFINISSVKEPVTSNVIISGVEMTLSNGSYRYELDGSYTDTPGIYFVEGYSNLDDPFISCFQITQSGVEFDNMWMNFIIIFLLSGGSFVLIYQFNESRSTIRGQDGNFIYYYLGAFMFFILGIYTLIFGFGGYKTLITQGLGYILWGSGLFFLTKPFYTGGSWKW